MSNDVLKHEGRCRTDMHCHSCSRPFIAEVDYSIDGNHIIACPICGHHHHRVIKGGMITEERFDSGGYEAVKDRTWATKSIETSSASVFLRRRWLESGG